MPTLDTLKPGQLATIEAIDGTGAAVQRLLEMGLTEGEQVSLVRVAPLGDPIEIRIRQYELSLRKADAARIRIRIG